MRALDSYFSDGVTARGMARRACYLVLLAGLAMACQGQTGPIEPAPSAEPTAAAEADGAEAQDQRFVALARPDDAAMLTAAATVTAEPGSRSQTTAVTRAQVVRALVRAGEPVEEGQPLVELRSPELLLAAARTASREAQVAAYSERLSAISSLQNEGLARRQDTFDLRVKIAELQAEATAAEATLKASGITGPAAAAMLRRGTFTLRSPIAGVVSQLNATPGTVYEPFASPPLVEVIGRGSAWVSADLMRAPPAQVEVTFESLDGLKVPLKPEPRSRVPLSTGGERLFYEPQDDADLVDGLKGRVTFTPTDEGAYQVPLDAVGQDGPVSFVRVLRSGGEQRLAVTVLGRSGTTALIEGALEASDRVAVPAGSPAVDGSQL